MLIVGESEILEYHGQRKRAMSNLLKQVDGVSSHLRNVYLELVKEFDSVIFRWSKYGVPHLVITTKVSTFSVCYFRRSKIFKSFSPYPS